jgi:hypothetical protein
MKVNNGAEDPFQVVFSLADNRCPSFCLHTDWHSDCTDCRRLVPVCGWRKAANEECHRAPLGQKEERHRVLQHSGNSGSLGIGGGESGAEKLNNNEDNNNDVDVLMC